MESSVIKIRGHHLNNLLHYLINRTSVNRFDIGLYGIEYIKNIKEIFNRIAQDKSVQIKLILTPDDICQACLHPHRDLCLTNLEDEQVIRGYGLRVGETYSQKEVVEKLWELVRKTLSLRAKIKQKTA